QRVGVEPLRQTQQGTLYKRDRERIVYDPLLSGTMADAMAPLPGLALLWLELAHRVGLVDSDESGQRLLAAQPGFWADNAVHLPQMIATGWLARRPWQERCGGTVERGVADWAVPYLRPALLLWLATLDEAEWVALDDLARHFSDRFPRWDRLVLTDQPDR